MHRILEQILRQGLSQQAGGRSLTVLVCELYISHVLRPFSYIPNQLDDLVLLDFLIMAQSQVHRILRFLDLLIHQVKLIHLRAQGVLRRVSSSVGSCAYTLAPLFIGIGGLGGLFIKH